MAITYTPTTNFGAKDSLPTNDPDKVIKGSEFTTEFTALQTAFSLAAPAASPTFTGTVTIPTADINGGNIDGTIIGAATPAAGSFTTFTSTGIDDNATSTAITIDASENVGIGRTPVTYGSFQVLDVAGATGAIQKIVHTGNNVQLQAYASSTAGVLGTATSHDLLFVTGDGERMRIDSSGNVGLGNGAYIGTLSSAHSLSIQGGAGAPGGKITLYGGTGSNRIDFLIGASEAARIDSSGNLLVGKTSVDNTTAGGDIYAGLGSFVKDGSRALTVVRKTSDGSLVEFRKDTATVGSIGSEGGDALYIQSGTTSGTGLLFTSNGTAIRAARNGVTVDATLDLGSSSRRFKDLYLSGGVVYGDAGSSGTATSNTLDSYEEGTWTPVVQGSGGGTYSYSTNGNYYTKIGRMVTLHFELINITQVTAGSGYIQIAGVPFAKGSGHQTTGSVLLHSLDWSNSGTYGVVQFITSAATSIMYIRINGDNYVGQDLQISALSSGVSDIQGSVSYLV